MKIKNLLILGLVLLGFTYCSSDDLVDGQKPGTEEATGVKMQVTIGMPTTRTRTATSADHGTDDEAQVNKVLIAIYDVNHNLVTTHTSTLGTDGGTANEATYQTEQFTINSLKVGSEYHVYAFANPYDGLDALLLSTSYDKGAFLGKGDFAATITAVTGAAESRNNFFMSNATTSKAVEVAQTHVKGDPLKVGIDVQRAVARMDYKDRGSKKGGEADFKTYIIPNSATIGENNVSVTFENFKPMNVSRSFFNLKRVAEYSDTGKQEDKIGGAETVDNYVVDTDWATKATVDVDAWKALFHSTFKTAATGDVEKNYVSMTDAETSKFYVTENTLPLDQNNKKGVATAVVFKGKLTFDASYTNVVADSKSKYTPSENSPVYVWNNKFYGTFDKLPQSIQNIVTDPEDSDDFDDDHIKGFNETLASAGVTGYSHDGTGYPIYYVYYNVHNQNAAIDGSVGPMEFGVVRNNIYKLTINNLSKFGHPNDPELVYTPGTSNPDPNPENPEDPIKSSDLYMQVTATVLDWTVRTNEIEF